MRKQQCEAHGSCSVHGEHQHHCHCCCGMHAESACSCGSHSCAHHAHEDFVHQLIEMADDAWMEVLRDKIKEEIIKKGGKHLDQLAKLVAESNSERWKHKLAIQKIISKDFKEKLSDFFTREK